MKLLYLIPHTSTGGMPQVTLKRIEELKEIFDIYVIEYKQIASTYIVQRSKIEELLGDKFISFGRGEELCDKFEQFIEDINPAVIHLEEIPELFMRREHADWLYRKDRPYKIFESTHTSTFNVDDKKYFPDKFLFVSLFSKKQYLKFDIPIDIIEYPIEYKQRNKTQNRKELGFDDNYFHVLNVGLFTPQKNQGYVFDIAKKLENHKIKFHFVGNQATNFENYWKPLMDNKPDNCIVWKERNDVNKFYDSADLFIFTSNQELNPLVIKEALSYDLPVFLFNLDVYCDKYDDNKNIKFLTGDLDKDSERIINFLENRLIKETSENFKSSLISEYEKKKISEKVTYNIDFCDGARVEILGGEKQFYHIEFLNKDNNKIEYKTKVETGNWCKTNPVYFKNWRITITPEEGEVVIHDYDAKDKNVLIQFDTKSLGDNLAFIPYVEEFRKKHECTVYCTTFWNNLFKEVYPEIKFLEPGKNVPVGVNIYARYLLGWFTPPQKDKNPIDFRKIPLQQTATDILGFEYKEIIPKIKESKGSRPLKEKYVCIAQYSTANAKQWHYPYKNSNLGWQILVDWLNRQGLKVAVISKQKTQLKNIIDLSGDFPIEHRINQIKHCEFFIGVGSGLSWLAWALGKKVVMISGFSEPFCEFTGNNIRIYNPNVCHGCFNKFDFDKGDWDWCPEHKLTDRQYECSYTLTPKIITDKIIENGLAKKINFNFDSYIRKEVIIIDVEKLSVKYNIDENKVVLHYNGNLPPLNIDIYDTASKKVLQFLTDVNLKKGNYVWFKPADKLEDKKVALRFYREKTYLEILLHETSISDNS